MPWLTAAQTSVATGVIIAAVVVGLIELALLVVALVDIVRRPAVLGGRKWVWVLVVLVFNLVGPIVYFAVGRAPLPVTADEGATRDDAGDRAAAAADLLYGPADGATDAPGDAAPPPPPPA